MVFLQGLLDFRGFVFVPLFLLDLTVKRVFKALLQLYGEAVFFFGLFLTSLSKVFLVPFLISSNFLDVFW